MKESLEENKIALGVAFGVVFGIIFGSVIDNVGLGIALGIALGVALGSTMQKEDHSNGKLNYNFLLTLYLHGFSILNPFRFKL